MARYVVEDLRDSEKKLVETDDMNIAYSAALQRYADTDGKCEVHIFDTETAPFSGNEYMFIEFWGEDED